MAECLYGANGFYTSGAGVAGRRGGDFITSPEVGPLFGAVLARWLDRQWSELGRPDPFVVVDAGTGPGTLLRSLEFAAPRCASAWRLVGVDLANGVDLPEDLSDSVVIANELLDNLPFRIVQRADTTPDAEGAAWVEVHVTDEATDVLVPIPMHEVPASLHDIRPATPAPLLSGARNWVTSVLDRGAARLLVFDYGAPTTPVLAARGGWLRTYRAHQRGDDPYREPGKWDITTDIGFDQLPPSQELMDQAAWLRREGIDQLVADGAAYWRSHAAAPDLEAMRMRSRSNEAAALLDPAGLGSWMVATWRT